MRNIITLADTTPTHTSSRSQRGTDNYVSKLKVDYSNNYDENSVSPSTTTTSQQLDDLLFELSKEAGFKSTKSYTPTKRVNSAIGNPSTYNSNNYNSQVNHTFRSASTIPTNHHTPILNTTGYYSEAETASGGVKKHVIDLELSPRKKSSAGRVHEKVTTRQEYLKEEYVGHKPQQHYSQQHKQQSSYSNNHAFSSAIHKSINSNQSGVSHKYHELHGFGEVNIPPVPPPRKHLASPSATQQFDALSAFNSYHASRFATTNTDSLSPPLEVKGIQVATKKSEDEDLEWRRRENKSVDRFGERFVSTSTYNNFRSGSLDIDLDDLVQRNLTNKASKAEDQGEDSHEKGAYYISGIERPAVRTKNLPHTKYIFKICSPDGEPEPTPTYSSHIVIPEPPPIKEVEPVEEKVVPQETEVISLEPIGPGVQLLESEGSRDGRASASRIITRSLSTSNRLQDTPINYLNTSSYSAYDSQSKEQLQPVMNEISNQALENYSSYKKSVISGGFPNYQQQLQWMQQQQQLQQPMFVAQPIFVPFNTMPVMNNGVKEYKDTVKYTETHTNVPANTMPTPLFPSQRLLAIASNTADSTNILNHSSMMRQLSVPITIETNKNSNSKQTYKDQQNNSNYALNTPINNYSNNTISGYSFSESKRDVQAESPMLSTTTPSSQHYSLNHAGSPETVRSWTVSPGSSIRIKEELKNEGVVNQTKQVGDSKSVAETSSHIGGELGLLKVKETAPIWHRPHVTRAEAVNLLKNKAAGSFIVRNSQSYSGGYGLALKVSQLPPNVEAKGEDFEANFVRHFLIESTTKGVRLKGCTNEPVFGSLSALIHQHTVTPLSLPCKLLLPDNPNNNHSSNTNINKNTDESGSLFKGQDFAESNSLNGMVVYIESTKADASSSDQEAFEKAISSVFSATEKPHQVTLIEMKISSQGIVLTDNKHKSFFRRHYPLDSISLCAVDPLEKPRTLQDREGNQYSGRVFGFIAKNQGASENNSCHLFMEFDDFTALSYLNTINQLVA